MYQMLQIYFYLHSSKVFAKNFQNFSQKISPKCINNGLNNWAQCVIIHEWFVSGKGLNGMLQKLPSERLLLIELDGNINDLIVGFEGNIRLIILNDSTLCCMHSTVSFAPTLQLLVLPTFDKKKCISSLILVNENYVQYCKYKFIASFLSLSTSRVIVQPLCSQNPSVIFTRCRYAKLQILVDIFSQVFRVSTYLSKHIFHFSPSYTLTCYCPTHFLAQVDGGITFQKILAYYDNNLNLAR